MLHSPAIIAQRAKYGKYLPHQRSNVDQVPLPFFINDMDITYEQVGAKRVCINQQTRLEAPGELWHRFLWDLGKFMARFFNVTV